MGLGIWFRFFTKQSIYKIIKKKDILKKRHIKKKKKYKRQYITLIYEWVNEMNEWINLLITKWNGVINTYSFIKIIEVIKKFN